MQLEFEDEVLLVYEGLLIKVNKFFMRQVRRFELYSNGEVKYYKNKD